MSNLAHLPLPRCPHLREIGGASFAALALHHVLISV